MFTASISLPLQDMRSCLMQSALTRRQPVFEAHPNLSVGMCGDSEPCLTLDVTFRKVNILLRCRVDDFYVDALTGPRSDVGGNND